MDTLLEIEELACSYGAEPVVDGLNLHLHAVVDHFIAFRDAG
jgi:hypothetical protein